MDMYFTNAAGQLMDKSPGSSSDIVARTVVTANGVSVVGAVNILAANSARTALTVKNDSDTKMYMRTDGVASAGVGYPLAPGGEYQFPPHMVPSGAISVYCASADKAWVAMYCTGA
jgi:hypothetical protein